MAELTTLGQQG